MINNLKALIVVLLIAGLVFHFVKPLCLRHMREEHFLLRRNVWLWLTCFAFASPNFWLFTLLAAPLLVWAARRDPNPAALFVLSISAVPPVTLAIPTIGIGALFDLNLARILALTVLLPFVMANAGKNASGRWGVVRAIDYSIAGFLLIQLVVLLPYDSVTNILRRGLHFILDYVLIYYVFSRSLNRLSSVYEVVAVFCLSCAILAPLSLFETIRTWLLYQGIAQIWGSPDPFAWLFRGSALRAQTSAGHSLTFGYHMAIGFGLSLLIVRSFASKKLTFLAGAWMWVGLMAAYARAPWLTAVLFWVLAAVASPGAASNLKRVLFVFTVGGAILYMSPYGDTVIDNLPFVGTVDSENVAYRQQLAATSWNLIMKNPLLGDPLVLRDMENLRQGQGIIDLVNSYAAVALFNGLVGLVLFILPMLLAVTSAYAIVKKSKGVEPADAALGARLVAAMLASLFFIATSGYGWLLFALLGLTTAYVRLDRREVTKLVPIDRVQPSVALPKRPQRRTGWS